MRNEQAVKLPWAWLHAELLNPQVNWHLHWHNAVDAAFTKLMLL